MGYRNLSDCVGDLGKTGRLIRIDHPIDARLEAAAIQRRVCQTGGPALLFTNIKGCRFPMLANLFGTMERTRYLFRDTLDTVQRLLQAGTDPLELLKQPSVWPRALRSAWHLWPRTVRHAAVTRCRTTIDQLPQMVSWPGDGGPFITLPLVYSESPQRPGLRFANLGMYRVQLAGNSYQANQEVGLHYQLHRGIGVHHTEALQRREPLRVNIFVGGPPSLTLAAIMPLPEDLPELCFAGLLGGRRMEFLRPAHGPAIAAQADFCICGTIIPDKLLPEGPFGDHLGYYSLQHDFPVLAVDAVYHRPDAIWPFTSVGRPPQEDSVFGAFIHELTGPLVPSLVKGVRAVHAVDAAGVHPLLLAIGSERYLPYESCRQPREMLTQAHALLGTGQLSLAKYLLMIADEDAPQLDIHDVGGFLRHLLERVDWRRDLHFQTRTSIDTLDYSGPALHQGSKVIIAAAGPPIRSLPTELPPDLTLPRSFTAPRLVLPGLLAIQAPPATADRGQADAMIEDFCAFFGPNHPLRHFPWVVLVDDSEFTAAQLGNFLWIAFTRSDPATDLYGIDAGTRLKHWGCAGPLVLDARLKPHYPAPLEEDPATVRRIEALAAPGGPLHGIV
jgi:4-hydroxy-3-polyprenylbenzoate decarboxylase